MKHFTLLNKKNNRRLVHPTVGMWYTPRLEEAFDMLESCKEYLRAVSLSELQNDFVVVDVETGEEVHVGK